jgi:hypothetical protein
MSSSATVSASDRACRTSTLIYWYLGRAMCRCATGIGKRLDRPPPPVPVRTIRPAVALGPVVGAVEWMPPGLDVVQHLPEDYQRPCHIRRRLAKLGSQYGKRRACSGWLLAVGRSLLYPSFQPFDERHRFLFSWLSESILRHPYGQFKRQYDCFLDNFALCFYSLTCCHAFTLFMHLCRWLSRLLLIFDSGCTTRFTAFLACCRSASSSLQVAAQRWCCQRYTKLL